MDIALIVDFGTTNIKAGLVNSDGKVLASSSKHVTIQRPEKGAAQHDPDELFSLFGSIINEVVGDYRDEVKILSLSGYQFGFMPMDADDNPLTGMITLLDTRSKRTMPDMIEKFPMQDIFLKTGCPTLFTYVFSRLIWLQKEKPEIFKKTAWFADIKSFIINKLTGKKYTEPGIASSSQLMNVNTFDWDPDILNFAGISKDQLPQIVSGEYVVDTLNNEMAESLNLKPGIPIIPGFYDGGSLIIGMGGINSDTGVCNIGTTGMLRSCSREVFMDDPEKQRIQTYGLIPDIWAIGGAVNNAGIALEWIRNHMSGNYDFDELNRQADSIAPGADGLFCLPFLTGERDPRIGNMASGSFFGLKDYHKTGHLARSVMEGVGYALNLIKGAIEDNGIKYKNLMIGGAGSKSDVWTKILANIFNTPIQRSLTTDPNLVGSAMLAFKSLGIYDSLESASAKMVKTGDIFEPDPEIAKIYQENYQFFLKLLNSYQQLYQEHSKIF